MRSSRLEPWGRGAQQASWAERRPTFQPSAELVRVSPRGPRGSRHPRTPVLTRFLPGSAASPWCLVSAGRTPASSETFQRIRRKKGGQISPLWHHIRYQGGLQIGSQKTGNVPGQAGASDPWGFQLDWEALGLSPPKPALPGWGLASRHASLVCQEGRPLLRRLRFPLVSTALVTVFVHCRCSMTRGDPGGG